MTIDDTPTPDDVLRIEGRALGIPDELLHTGPTSAEAFEEWIAPRRAAYNAARDRFEDLARRFEDLANANPRYYVTIDEEHTTTGRIWLTSTGDERPIHEHALGLLDDLRALLTGMDTTTPAGPHNLAENGYYLLEALRRMVLHHQDFTDPAGAEARARRRRLDAAWHGRPAPDTVATPPRDAYRSDL